MENDGEGIMPRRLFTAKLFERDLKRIMKQGKDTGKLKETVSFLSSGEPLPAKTKDHALTGNWKKISGVPH